MDAETLRRMQAVASATWAIEGSRAPLHVGDLAWMRYQHRGREHEWQVRLWQQDGRDVAWAWVRTGSMLFWCILPELRSSLEDEILAWADAPAVEVKSTDAAALASLERYGYRIDPEAKVLAVHDRPLANEPHVSVPEGFRLRTVGPDDFAARVELHQIVWAPSRVTEESYADVQAAWPYRADLDCVVEAPDGRLAAYCLAWLDPDNRVGEFEPVGTHPDFRRLGLGSAVCRFALRRLEEEGATAAMVYAIAGDPENPGPKALYESIGFVEASRILRYSRADSVRG